MIYGADGGEEEGVESDEEEAQVQRAAEAKLAGELPGPCLDVTLALRYMVDNSHITFHQVFCYFLHYFPCELTLNPNPSIQTKISKP